MRREDRNKLSNTNLEGKPSLKSTNSSASQVGLLQIRLPDNTPDQPVNLTSMSAVEYRQSPVNMSKGGSYMADVMSARELGGEEIIPEKPIKSGKMSKSRRKLQEVTRNNTARIYSRRKPF